MSNAVTDVLAWACVVWSARIAFTESTATLFAGALVLYGLLRVAGAIESAAVSR